MSEVHQLTAQEARRIAVRAQLLDADRPDELFDLVRRLAFLQNDPTAAVAPHAELAVWSRIGSSCPYGAVEEAFEEQALIDLGGLLRLPEDLRLFRSEMAEWPGVGEVPSWLEGQARWVAANKGFRADILAELQREGPLVSKDLPDTCDVSWKSSGWNNNRNVRMMLEMLVLKGEVAVAGRRGRERLWDLAERVYPDDDPVPSGPALRIRNERRLHALGIARARGTASPSEPNGVEEVGEAAEVEGLKGRWRVDPAYLDGARFRGRVAIISPLDRVVFERRRMEELFDFDYQLEMYKPAHTRRWGYWAMPILDGDRFVGKVDATTDRKQHVLRVDAIHEDEPFSTARSTKLRRELADLASWLDVDLLLPD